MDDRSPDVYTLADLQEWERSAKSWEPAEKPVLAVFGDPVAHSLSPQMMNPALKEMEISGRYIRIHVRETEFTEAVRLLPKLGFHGANVTIPHKFKALENMDEVDSLAQQLGAVNTIMVEGDQLLGFNSDGPGFLRSIREAFQVDVSDLQVMVLGAGGGAGQAVAMQCALEQCERLVLVNRTEEKVRALYEKVKPHLSDERVSGPMKRLEVVRWEHGALAEQLEHIDLIVNSTPLGMKRTDPAAIPASLLQPHHLIYDMVYQPARTKLIQAAEAAGARAINGLSMLLHQGVISLEIWFDRKAPVDAMRRHLAEAAAGR